MKYTNKLLSLTNEQLFEHVTTKLFADNPQLKRGQRMSGPVQANDGGTSVLEASSFRIPCSATGELASMETTKRGWFYPYQVLFPMAEQLRQWKIGEMTAVMDPDSFELKLIPVTEQMISSHTMLLLRGAFSEVFWETL